MAERLAYLYFHLLPTAVFVPQEAPKKVASLNAFWFQRYRLAHHLFRPKRKSATSDNGRIKPQQRTTCPMTKKAFIDVSVELFE